MTDEAFELIQLNESEVDCLVKFFAEQNGFDRTAKTDSITLALKHGDIRICSVQIHHLEPVIHDVVVMTPDKMIKTQGFSNIRKGQSGICESTGDTKIDEIVSQAVRMFHLFEEDMFAWFISEHSGGSTDEKWQEYGEEYEKMRSDIIKYEGKMREKYQISN